MKALMFYLYKLNVGIALQLAYFRHEVRMYAHIRVLLLMAIF